MVLRMSFYKFTVFLTLFLICINARKLFVPLSRSSGGVVKHESGVSGENGGKTVRKTARTLPIPPLKAVTHVVQSLRRLLKMVRKWCRSHPSEVKLGKCLASYFNIRLPELRRSENFMKFNDDEESWIKPPVKMSNTKPRKRDADDGAGDSTSSIDETTSTKSFSLIFTKYFQSFLKKLWHYRDIVTQNELANCSWHYIVKNFWAWVDSAPID